MAGAQKLFTKSQTVLRRITVWFMLTHTKVLYGNVVVTLTVNGRARTC